MKKIIFLTLIVCLLIYYFNDFNFNMFGNKFLKLNDDIFSVTNNMLNVNLKKILEKNQIFKIYDIIDGSIVKSKSNGILNIEDKCIPYVMCYENKCETIENYCDELITIEIYDKISI